MAPNKSLPEDPPAASSMEEDSDAETIAEEEEEVENDVVEDEKEESGDEEEEEEEDDEEEEEEEEDDDNEEEENVNAKKPNVPNPQSESASDDDNADADSETESDNMNHSPSASDFTVKPIIYKPMTDSPAKKPTKKPAAAAAAPAKPTSGSKRAAETDWNPKDSKKRKGGGGGNGGGGDDEDSKKGQGRLWGEDDEIAILQGMIEFKAKKDQDASANMGAFHEFLKKNLKADVSKNQLMDKARRLKKKYQTNADKGDEAVFAKAHELKSFELSKRIWGVEANGADDGGKSGKKKPRKSAKANNNNSSTVLALPVTVPGLDSGEKSARNNVEKKSGVNVANGGGKTESEEFWSTYPYLRDSLRVGSCSSNWEGMETVVSQSLASIGSSKARGLDERWRKLHVLEMELAVKKLDLKHEQAKLALDAMKLRKD